MAKFYSITKGQLIVVWAFGIIGWLYALNGSYNEYIGALLSFILWLIPFFLFFYTIGWRNRSKNKPTVN